MEGEKSKKEVEKVRTVSGSNGTLASLQLFPGNGTAKVVEEGGGAKRFKGRHNGLIVMSVATEGRTWAEFLVKFFRLGFLLRQAIMESEDRDPLVVKETK